MAGDLTVGQLRIILEADSSKFAAAMKDANADTKKLADSLKKELEPSTRGINAAFKQFLGTNEIRRAQEMAAAVQKLGGATKLTAADQVKLNTAVSGAIAHYKALGVQAPANLLAIQKATAGAAQAATGMGGALKTSFATLTASFTAANLITKAVTSVVDLGVSAVKSAGQIVDLSKKTGLSIEAVQRLGFVAKQNGGSLEQMADAVFKTGLQIEKGSKKTKDAIEELGLSFADIRAMKPEDQFDAIMRALASIEDPQRRNALGVAAMGKSYADVAASVDGYIEALKNAPVANADAIKATDDAADAIERAWDKAEKAAINAIGGILQALERGLAQADRSGSAIADALKKSSASNPMMSAMMLGDLLARGIMGDTELPAVQAPTVKPASIQALKDYAAELRKTRDEVAALTAEQRKQIAAALELGESTSDISNELNITEDAIELYKEQVKDAANATKQKQEALANLSSSLSTLTTQQYDHIAVLLQANKGEADIAKAYGYTAQQVKDVAEREKNLADIRELQVKNADALLKVMDKMSRAAETEIEKGAFANAKNFAEAWIRQRKRMAEENSAISKDIEADFIEISKVEREALMMSAERSLSHYDFQRFQVQTWAEEQKESFTGTKEQAKQFYAAIDMLAAEKLAAIKDTWTDAFDHIADGFDQLASILKGDMSEIARGLGGAASTVKLLDTSFRQLDQASTFKQTVGGIFGVVGALAQAVGMAVNLGKALHDAFTRSESEKAAADIRRQWGQIDADLTQIQEDDPLAKRIEQMVKDMGITRLDAANILMPELVQRAGGIDAANFEGFAKSAHGLFETIAKGGQAGTEAVDSLNEMMGLLGDHLVKQGGLWDENFISLIERAKREGVELAKVMELVKGQLDIASSGANKVVAGSIFSFEKAFQSGAGMGEEGYDELVKKAESANFDIGKAFTTQERRRWEAAQRTNANIVANYQEEFDRISRITLATFNAQIANGANAADAIRLVGPAIDDLIAASDRFGFAGNAAYDALARWSNLVEFNAPLLEQVAGLKEMMVALANVGALDVQTFQDMQAQGLDTFESLTEAGFTQQEALAQMKPLLETLRKLHKERGLAIDDETQALIDQAEEQGILAEEAQSTNDILKEGLGQLIQLLGGQLPDAWKKNEQAAKQSFEGIKKDAGNLAQALKDKIGGLDFDIPIEFDVDPSAVRGLHGIEVPGAAEGAFVPKRPGGTLMRVGEGSHDEWIIPSPDLKDLMDQWNAGPSLPNLSPTSALSGVAGGEIARTSDGDLYMTLDTRVLGEVSTRTNSLAASRFGLGRS